MIQKLYGNVKLEQLVEGRRAVAKNPGQLNYTSVRADGRLADPL